MDNITIEQEMVLIFHRDHKNGLMKKHTRAMTAICSRLADGLVKKEESNKVHRLLRRSIQRYYVVMYRNGYTWAEIIEVINDLSSLCDLIILRYEL